MSDATFIQNIQANPDDPTCRLVYADWLEERGDERAEYLRLEHAIATESLLEPQYWEMKARWRQLRSEVDKAWRVSLGDDDTYRPMFGTLPTHRMDRWRRMIRFFELWIGPYQREYGNTTAELAAAEAALGEPLPVAMREFYLLAGNVLHHFQTGYGLDAWSFLTLDRIHREDHVLWFAEGGEFTRSCRLGYAEGAVVRDMLAVRRRINYGASFCNFVLRQLLVARVNTALVVLVGMRELGEVPIWLSNCPLANFNLGTVAVELEIYEGERFFVMLEGRTIWIVSRGFDAIQHLPLHEFDPLERTLVQFPD